MVSVGSALGVTLTGLGGIAFFLIMRRPALLHRASAAQFRFYRPLVGRRRFDAFYRSNSRLLLGFAVLSGLLTCVGVVELIRALLE
ncbi:MAG: hypothetical protein QOJ23_4854 [Actinomycetota bacterium]|nr:hypothetical protein [Actinomycetota bacterium]MDQ1496900.1 hypothetical protein [Actinomycetota bacterium]